MTYNLPIDAFTSKTDFANSKAELLKWEKAAELAKKDKNYLRFINEINNESTAIKETMHLLSSKPIEADLVKR